MFILGPHCANIHVYICVYICTSCSRNCTAGSYGSMCGVSGQDKTRTYQSTICTDKLRASGDTGVGLRIALTITQCTLRTRHAQTRAVIYVVPITGRARAMNTVKFRKDRKHKSRDKRRIVLRVHCELLQVSLPRGTCDDSYTQFSFPVARNFQRPPRRRTGVTASSQFSKHTRARHFGADFGPLLRVPPP